MLSVPWSWLQEAWQPGQDAAPFLPAQEQALVGVGAMPVFREKDEKKVSCPAPRFFITFFFFFFSYKDAEVQNGLEDTGRGKGKLGRSERVAWTYIYTTKWKTDS